MDITLSDVTVRLPDHRTLFHIEHFVVQSGARVLIQGPSGIGKTTFLHLIAGLFLPEKGSVELGKVRVDLLTDRERSRLRRRSIGIIFQRLNLIDHLNALENVVLPFRNVSDARGKAIRALGRLNLGTSLNSRIATLSPGEQQRVAVARILASTPPLILADEPTSSLDEVNAHAVLDALWEASEGNTLVVVSHDRRIYERFSRPVEFTELINA